MVGPVYAQSDSFSRWNGTFIYGGGGVEFRLGNKFAMGGEGGVLSKTGYTTGIAAFTPAVHFLAKDSKSKIDPFVNFGISILMNTGSVSTPMVHLGGGMNYSLGKRIGARFEYRHHVWSPEADEWVQLAAFRAGIVFGF